MPMSSRHTSTLQKTAINILVETLAGEKDDSKTAE